MKNVKKDFKKVCFVFCYETCENSMSAFTSWITSRDGVIVFNMWSASRHSTFDVTLWFVRASCTVQLIFFRIAGGGRTFFFWEFVVGSLSKNEPNSDRRIRIRWWWVLGERAPFCMPCWHLFVCGSKLSPIGFVRANNNTLLVKIYWGMVTAARQFGSNSVGGGDWKKLQFGSLKFGSVLVGGDVSGLRTEFGLNLILQYHLLWNNIFYFSFNHCK